MSILSNHHPDLLDDLNGTACACPPNGQGAGDMCPACQSDYDQWARREEEQLKAEYDAIVEILPEPCGQQFPDEPPFDPPF